MVRGPLKSLETATTSRAGLARGSRAVKRSQSSYLSPMAARIERQGVAEETVARLLALRRKVARGSTLLELVADGTESGWRLRMALSSCAGEPLDNWDGRGGRTQLERQALVERALGEFGQQTLSLGGAL